MMAEVIASLRSAVLRAMTDPASCCSTERRLPTT